METGDITKLCNLDYTVENIFAMRQMWHENSVFTMSAPRPTDALLYFCGCDAIYTVGATTHNAKMGDVVFIPHGATYKTEFINVNQNETSAVLFEFLIHPTGSPEGTSFSISDRIFAVEHNVAQMREKFFSLVDTYKSLSRPTAAVKAIAYGILADFSDAARTKRLFSKKYSIISKGIVFLEENYDKNPTVSELARMCAVSESTFRELFKEYSGFSPTEFIAHGKTERAKKLLSESGLSIAEISEQLGFYDTPSFCRFFKDKVGETASAWRRKRQLG